jgi:hypothetical protein
MTRPSNICRNGHDKGGTGRCYQCWRARKQEYRLRMRLKEAQSNYPQVIPELARKPWLASI